MRLYTAILCLGLAAPAAAEEVVRMGDLPAISSAGIDIVRRPQIFVDVILPGALPNTFTGLRLGAGMALILVFITEIEATKAGLGFLLWDAFQLLETKRVFASVVAFGLLGIGATWLLQWVERRVCP